MTPKETVTAYLRAMEERDLDRAKGFLTPGYESVFPGGVRLSSPQDVVAWAAPRYRWVKKRFEGLDEAGDVVYCYGTLYGEWPDGTPFEGIRYIDRFEIADGLIARSFVWNDIAEVRALQAVGAEARGAA
jgi:hypothetical protein